MVASVPKKASSQKSTPSHTPDPSPSLNKRSISGSVSPASSPPTPSHRLSSSQATASTSHKSSSEQKLSETKNVSPSSCPLESISEVSVGDSFGTLHNLLATLLCGMLLGGFLVYFFAPPSLRLDSSFLSKYSFCNATTAATTTTTTSCPTCPINECPASLCTYLTAQDELLVRGGVSSNPKNAPSVEKYEAPRILPLEEFVTSEEANQLIETVLTSEKFEVGRVANPENAQNRSSNRIVSMTVLNVKNPKYRWLYERLMTTVQHYNSLFWQYRLPSNIDSVLLEPIQFYKYEGNDHGHYNWHSDVGIKGATAKRRLSVSVQLSPEDAYEGGDLMIKPSSDEIPLLRKQGTMFLFPSFLLHKVTRVTKGTRYSLVAWIETA